MRAAITPISSSIMTLVFLSSGERAEFSRTGSNPSLPYHYQHQLAKEKVYDAYLGMPSFSIVSC